jgi:hypothetical protein
MVETTLKRGPFDCRYPSRPLRVTPARPLQPELDGLRRLDWSDFLHRFYPDRPRHDFETLAAYLAYGHAVEASERPKRPLSRPAGGGSVVANVLASPVREESPPLVLGEWESEGGSVELRLR